MKPALGEGLVLPGPRAPAALPGLCEAFHKNTVRLFAGLGPRVPARLRARHREACERVKEGLRLDPAAVLGLFALPEVSAPVRCAAASAPDSPFRPRIEAALEGAVTLAQAGRTPDLPGLRPVADLAFLSLEDANPIALLEAHPDKRGNAASLGGRPVEEWLSALSRAASLIERGLPQLYREMRLVLKRIVPVGYDAERHLSASYREAVGIVYVTLHPDPQVLADALVHEYQHNKLHLAADFDPLLTNAFSPLYPSPVRPDPRPLWGILMAVHAFLPVARLRRALRDLGEPGKPHAYLGRLHEIDRKNAEGMGILRAHARWTPAGRRLMDGLEDVERSHRSELEAAGVSSAPDAAHED